MPLTDTTQQPAPYATLPEVDFPAAGPVDPGPWTVAPSATLPDGNFLVERLPPVETDFPGQDLGAPAVPSVPAVSSPDPAPADLPRGTRPGVFQKLLFEASWLPRDGTEGFGFDTLELKTVLGLPCPTREYPLLITPGFAVHYLQGPAAITLPPQLYDAYVELRWLGHLVPRLGYDVAVTPAVDSDFRQSSSHALRVTGHGIAAWTCSPTITLVLGADYLDRTDVPLLPVAGLVWKPNDDAKFELVFPQPKISHRVYWNGVRNPGVEDWVYIGGELGGGTWAIQRADGASDVLNYRDLRAFLGIERKAFGHISPRFEVGYVFYRKLELDQAQTDFVPTNTLMVRGALAY